MRVADFFVERYNLEIMDIDPEEIIKFLEQPQRIPYQIEIELNCLVTTNHRFLLEAITKIEDEELEGIKDEDEYREQQKNGSAQQSVRVCILRDFLESDEFALRGGQALRL